MGLGDMRCNSCGHELDRCTCKKFNVKNVKKMEYERKMTQGKTLEAKWRKLLSDVEDWSAEKDKDTTRYDMAIPLVRCPECDSYGVKIGFWPGAWKVDNRTNTHHRVWLKPGEMKTLDCECSCGNHWKEEVHGR